MVFCSAKLIKRMVALIMYFAKLKYLMYSYLGNPDGSLCDTALTLYLQMLACCNG